MIRTIIGINADEKKWLDKVAETRHISMAEVIRLAIAEYRERHPDLIPSDLNELLLKTKGIWPAGEGLRYQKKLRDEWEDR